MISFGLIILAILLVSFISFALVVRYSPIEQSEWHIDPQFAELPSSPNAFKQSYTVNVSKDNVIDRFGKMSFDGEKVSQIAGDLSEGFATFEARTPKMGYPDYINIKITKKGKKSEVYFFSRSRFGHSDLGRNQARIEAWIDRLR